MGELKWFLLAFFVLFVLWALTGGPARVENRERPYLEQPAPLESGRTYTQAELRARQGR